MNNRLSINGIMKIANLCLLIVLENYALDYGMGFLTASYILVAWLYMILMGNVANAMTKMVVSRVNNGLYGNAKKIFRCLMGYTAFISIISFFLIYFLADTVSANVFGAAYISPLLKLFGILFLLGAVSDTLNGYYLGMTGNTRLFDIACLIRTILPVTLGILVVKLFRDYGEKVSALLKEPLYTNLYAATGAVLVQIICSALVLFLFLILFRTYRDFQSDGKNEIKRGIDSTGSIIRNFFIISVALLKNTVFPLTTGLIVTLLYFNIALQKNITVKTIFCNYGILVGKVALLCLIPFMIYKEYAAREKMKIHTLAGREEWKNVSVRSLFLLKNTIYILSPPTVFLILLADPIVKVLFTGNYMLSAQLLRLGGILLLLGGVSYAMDGILCIAHKETYAFFIRLICLVVQSIFLAILLLGLNGSVFCVLYSFMIKYVLAIVLDLLTLKMVMPIKYEDILAKTIKVAIALIIPSIVEILLDKFLMMNIPLLFISIFAGYLLFYICIFAVRGINKRDEISLKKSFAYIPIHFISKRLGLW